MTMEPASGQPRLPRCRNDAPRSGVTRSLTLEERLMKLITTLAAAAFIAGSATLAMAQGGGAAGSGGTGASGGIGGVGAGADPATPRQNMTRPTPNTPAVNRRGLRDLRLRHLGAAGDEFLYPDFGFLGDPLGLGFGALNECSGFGIGLAPLCLILRQQLLGFFF